VSNVTDTISVKIDVSDIRSSSYDGSQNQEKVVRKIKNNQRINDNSDPDDFIY
jgi:hypothetical protein